MAAWVAWVIAALLLAIGEVFTPGLFFLGPVALAAVVGALVAVAGAAVWIQLIAFAGAALASLALLRPLARAHLRVPPALRTGTAALQGAKATVLQRVDEHGGRVKIGGEEWSARAYMPDGVYEPGAQVEVVEIKGATALVYE
ncbi:MAG TPA: NfeD family protein [Gaiellaceae bacterium]|nr:NfeD family protein [Gaiellaceae bacterium]